MSTTSLKLPDALKSRIQHAAELAHTSTHAFMLGALESEVRRLEARQSFEADAMEAMHEMDQGGAVYASEDVHAWFAKRMRGEAVPRPLPIRGKERTPRRGQVVKKKS